jgi:hypothetical protein
MPKVSQWLKLAADPHPLDTKCQVRPYKGWYWRTVAEKDPEWILWLVTESKVLLIGDLERELLDVLRNCNFQELDKHTHE